MERPALSTTKLQPCKVGEVWQTPGEGNLSRDLHLFYVNRRLFRALNVLVHIVNLWPPCLPGERVPFHAARPGTRPF